MMIHLFGCFWKLLHSVFLVKFSSEALVRFVTEILMISSKHRSINKVGLHRKSWSVKLTDTATLSRSTTDRLRESLYCVSCRRGPTQECRPLERAHVGWTGSGCNAPDRDAFDTRQGKRVWISAPASFLGISCILFAHSHAWDPYL